MRAARCAAQQHLEGQARPSHPVSSAVPPRAVLGGAHETAGEGFLPRAPGHAAPARAGQGQQAALPARAPHSLRIVADEYQATSSHGGEADRPLFRHTRPPKAGSPVTALTPSGVY